MPETTKTYVDDGTTSGITSVMHVNTGDIAYPEPKTNGRYDPAAELDTKKKRKAVVDKELIKLRSQRDRVNLDIAT